MNTFAQNVCPMQLAAAAAAAAAAIDRFRSGIQMAAIIYAQTFANSIESV